MAEKIKICTLAYGSSTTYIKDIASNLRLNGFIVDEYTHIDRPDLTKYNIMIVCQWVASVYYDTDFITYITNAYTAGVHLIEILYPQQSTFSFAYNYIDVSSIAYNSLSARPNIFIKNDIYGIGLKSGLNVDNSQSYQMSIYSGPTINFTIKSQEIELYKTDAANPDIKAVLLPKGKTTSTITNTPAHYVAFGDIFNGTTNSIFTTTFHKYMLSLVLFMSKIYKVKGKVQDSNGVGIERDVYINERTTGELITKIRTNADGTFDVNISTSSQIFVIAKAEDGDTQPTVVYDKIQPLPILY